MVAMTASHQPGFSIDESTDFGARAARHLREDVVLWLTTVSPSGAPSPNPVWFTWDGAATVELYSLPDAARVRHLRANPRVTLHFDGDGQGGDIVVLAGTAEVRPTTGAVPPADAVPAYLAKYAARIPNLGLTPAAFAEQYATPITVTLTRLRGY